MATLSHSESRRLYSWWWDSHISPKNSKWLKENLTDMDAKVKTMIKLIEEDADSFRKRADMYYKKRPELMKLVEEFYRAYRALAERYDHATGALRQAHQTMAEAFPHEVPFVLADDSSSVPSTKVELHISETPRPMHAMLDSDDLHKDAPVVPSSQFQAIKRNGASSNESDSVTSKKGLKLLDELFSPGEGAAHYVKFAEGRMRKGLNYHEEGRNKSDHEKPFGSEDQSVYSMKEKEQILRAGISNQNLTSHIKSSSEDQTLHDSLAKLVAEKEAGLLQYQQALERLSNLEAEVSRAQEEARGFNERASKAESEVQTLNEAVTKLQAEKEADLLQYQQCMERMSNLENKISHVREDPVPKDREMKEENETQYLKQVLARLEAEKEASLLQYNQCLGKLSNLDAKISLAEENARNLSERAVRAETEVQLLKEAIAKLEKEKEAASLQYQRSLETISSLKSEVSHAQEKAMRLSSVIVMGLAKLSSTEEQYLQLERENQSLQTEVDSLVQMMTLQKQELSEKYEELERLQTSIEEECLRSMEAEAAVQTLRNLHSESQEERESLAMEVQISAQRLKDIELEYQGLKEEVSRATEENKILKEQNLSSAIVGKNLQDEVFGLRKTEIKLEKEVEALVDQRKSLEHEINYLNNEISDLKMRHLSVIEQIELVGLKPDCLGSSLKSLHDEISRLKEICKMNNNEKVSLIEKLKNMEYLLEKNAFLDSSLSDVSGRLELLREKVKELQEACQSLKRVNSVVVVEKECLFSQLEIANRNVEKLSAKNTFLETFLYDANVEREWLKEKSKCLEDFCQSLHNEKLDLFTANEDLVSQFICLQQKLDDLGRNYADSEVSHLELERDLKSKTHQIDELHATLSCVNQEHARFVHASEMQVAYLEGNNLILQEEGKRRLKEFEAEQDNTLLAQLEIFILQRCIHDMEERHYSLSIENQKHLEATKISENLVTDLEKENFEHQVKVNSLLNQAEKIRFGLLQMALLLEIDPGYECQGESKEDHILLQLAMEKIGNLKSSLCTTEDEKHQLLYEKTVYLALLRQLRFEIANIDSKSSALDRNLKVRTEELLLLQSERNVLKSASDHLNRQIGVGKEILNQKETKLFEKEQKLEAIEGKNKELHSALQDLKGECDEARLTREASEKQILNILESNSHKNEEIECLHEVTEKLELELKGLNELIEEQQVRENNLTSELQQKIHEIELQDYEAETLYLKYQVADIHAAMFREKVRELVGACGSLEDESNSKAEYIEQLKERRHWLESENKEINSKLAAFLPAVVSLMNIVTSLEQHVGLETKKYADDNQKKEVADLETHQHDNTNKGLTENQSFVMADGILDLLELQTRIRNIESSVVEQKRLIMLENFDKNIKLDAAMKTIQKLEQSGNGSSRHQLHNTVPEFSEAENEILVKDIPLDQVSHCSSYDHGFVPRRDNGERDEEILELWDTEKRDFDLDLTFNQKQKLAAVPIQEISRFHQIEPVEKSEYPSSEIQSEDLSTASKRITGHQEGDKRKILERLASDAQKLMNLQLMVQDLNEKVEQLEKSKKPKDTEFNTVKEQLKQVEDAITQLVGTNDKLSKKAEAHPVISDRTVSVDAEETGSARRCRLSERARRASEKIGRLQIEAQRIQFVLLRLEDKYKTKGIKIADRKVILKDYLYGTSESPPGNKRKKHYFFSCVKISK